MLQVSLIDRMVFYAALNSILVTPQLQFTLLMSFLGFTRGSKVKSSWDGLIYLYMRIYKPWRRASHESTNVKLWGA